MANKAPQHPFLSVIIPAYNEEGRLPETIRRVESYLAGQPYTWELIVVDDGSTDRTVDAAREAFTSPDSRLIKNPRNLGKGASIKNGMIQAEGKYRLFSDADLSTPIEETEKLLRALRRKNAGVAIASRAMKKSRLEQRQPFYREWMGRTFNLIVQLFALRGIRDTQCGFKLFTAEAARKVFPAQTFDGFSFDVEVLFLARRAGYKIVEVPVRWINSPASRVNPIRDSAKMFLDVIRLRLRHG